eukprot:Amastigsp_a677407_86.p3 type:complete len:143 gc:universal Amastigsp_a677407_86:856-1284(+)
MDSLDLAVGQPRRVSKTTELFAEMRRRVNRGCRDLEIERRVEAEERDVVDKPLREQLAVFRAVDGHLDLHLDILVDRVDECNALCFHDRALRKAHLVRRAPDMNDIERRPHRARRVQSGVLRGPHKHGRRCINRIKVLLRVR